MWYKWAGIKDAVFTQSRMEIIDGQCSVEVDMKAGVIRFNASAVAMWRLLRFTGVQLLYTDEEQLGGFQFHTDRDSLKGRKVKHKLPVLSIRDKKFLKKMGAQTAKYKARRVSSGWYLVDFARAKRGDIEDKRDRKAEVELKKVKTRPFSTITVTGESGKEYLAVPPHGHLCKPPEDYFPGCTIDEWFAHGEQWRKDKMRWRWGNYCMLTGRSAGVEVHEIDAKGHGKKMAALVPWNQIIVNSVPHRRLQSRTWQVVRYDVLAWPYDRTGIRIVDCDGKEVPAWWNLSQYEREKNREYR